MRVHFISVLCLSSHNVLSPVARTGTIPLFRLIISLAFASPLLLLV